MPFEPHRTAIARNRPSVPATSLTAPVVECSLESRKKPIRLLDWGAGRGADAAWYRERWGKDVQVTLYDPYFAPELPKGKFDVITCYYVLNVLPVAERLLVLVEASKFLRKDGFLLVAARSPKEIDFEAKKGRWEKTGDGGYITSRKTYQAGLWYQDVTLCAQVAGLAQFSQDGDALLACGRDLMAGASANVSWGVFVWP